METPGSPGTLETPGSPGKTEKPESPGTLETRITGNTGGTRITWNTRNTENTRNTAWRHQDPGPYLTFFKKHTKSRYKYEIRRLKRREPHIRREKMATALASSNTKSFWQQVHKVNRSNKVTPVSSVDGISGDVGISQLFSTKLQSLLNCQECPEREALLSSCTSSLCPEDLAQSTISECVAKAFTHLKPGKSDGTHTGSDHWVLAAPALCSTLAAPALCSTLAALFTAILRHGYMPKS